MTSPLSPPKSAAREDGAGTVFTSLRAANIARQIEWAGGQEVSLLYRANELAGEVGEACNVVKKIERERAGWRGSRATLADLAGELADVVICADLAAMAAGIDLDAAIARTFNATSEKVGLQTRLAPPASEDPTAAGLPPGGDTLWKRFRDETPTYDGWGERHLMTWNVRAGTYHIDCIDSQWSVGEAISGHPDDLWRWLDENPERLFPAQSSADDGGDGDGGR